VPDPAPGQGPGGGKGPDSYVPEPRFEYKAPSIIAEHKYLAVIFVLAIMAATVAPGRALRGMPGTLSFGR